MKRILWPLIAAASLLGPFALAADWSENFDSYANGTVLQNINGWSGWDQSQAAAGVVTNQLSQSAPNSMRCSSPTDAVHEWSGVTSGVWKFKTYIWIQSEMISGQPYFIMLNRYEAGSSGIKSWSVQVHFDIALGTCADDFNNTGITVPIKFDAWVPIEVNIDLDNNAVATYYNSTLVSSGVWDQPTDPNALKNIAAIDLYGNTINPAVYYDDCSLVQQALTFYPADYTVSRGSEVGNHDPLKLKDADGVLFVSISQKLQVSPALANAEITAPVMIPDPKTVKTATVTVVLRANDTPYSDPTCTQKISLKDQTTGSYVVVDERKPTGTWATIPIALDAAGVAKYINQTTGEIDVRAGEFHGKPLSAGWKEDVDQIKVDITR